MGWHLRQRKASQATATIILAFRDPSGAPLEPRILVDNKDKAVVAESDITKLVRDAKERSTPVAILVAREESQLRSVDKECPLGLQGRNLDTPHHAAVAPS